jgi:hypothetical protein
MPAAWNADRRRSQAGADFWNPTGVVGDLGQAVDVGAAGHQRAAASFEPGSSARFATSANSTPALCHDGYDCDDTCGTACSDGW